MRIPPLRPAAVLSLALFFGAPPLCALTANRVFVSARSGNDANSCDNILTPCKTFAGAVLELNLGGEAIVLDSGGYGPVTITQSLTIEAPPGVLAFIHPPSGDAITISAGASDVVTLRGLVLNAGSNGINVVTVGTLNVTNCSISGFTVAGIGMYTGGRLNVRGTDVTSSDTGILVNVSSGTVLTSIDHCHLDRNQTGFQAWTISPGSSTTTASYSTADHNIGSGWLDGEVSSGKDILYLEFCTGSENALDGGASSSTNAASVLGFSNCLFANNGQYGMARFNTGAVESRGNSTVRNNGLGPSNVGLGSFPGF